MKSHASLGAALAAALFLATHLAEPANAIEATAPAVDAAQYQQWFEEISNWGRWGDDDEMGTLNLITPEKRLAAARLVQDGVAVSMALDLNTVQDEWNQNPFFHERETSVFGNHQVAGDEYRVSYHGFAHSHVDGLPHFAHGGFFYNGLPFEGLVDGVDTLGIHNAKDGIVTRGVLVDMAWFMGVDFLEPGAAIMPEDFEAWEERTGIEIGSGDVLLVRTGRWERVRQKGRWNFVEAAAGSHASLAKWLRERDVAVIGCDGVSDVMPGNVEGLVNPLHQLVLAGLGMLILDNLDLDAVAAEARKRDRWEFLFVGAPLRVRGGTGSPLNPLAVF